MPDPDSLLKNRGLPSTRRFPHVTAMEHLLLNPARDPLVEDPTNLWLIDPLARRLVPLAVRCRIPANAISIAGLLVGAAAGVAYSRWQRPGWAEAGLLISILWMVMDSLDGMVARATGTCSPLGRELDGMCDHGVFACLYFALARSAGLTIWSLVIAAAVAHAIQANLYEAERDRFHRRLQGRAADAGGGTASRNPAVRLYDRVAACLNSASAPFDRLLEANPLSRLRRIYRRSAVPVLRLMVPLSQNMRLLAIFVACLLGRMTMFLWFEIGPLTLLTAIGILWHRNLEARLMQRAGRFAP